MFSELKRRLKKITIPLILSTLIVPAFADSKKSTDVTGFLSGGLTFGGDTLGTVVYDDGDTENIKAGEFFFFSGGVLATQDNFQLQGSIGYYSDEANADNGDVGFTRIPLEFLTFWKQEKFRLGGGLTYHVDPEFEIDLDGDPNNGKVKFDDALGFVVQADYLFDNGFTLGVRYTAIDYEYSDIDAEDVDGSSTGVVLGYIF